MAAHMRGWGHQEIIVSMSVVLSQAPVVINSLTSLPHCNKWVGLLPFIIQMEG